MSATREGCSDAVSKSGKQNKIGELNSNNIEFRLLMICGICFYSDRLITASALKCMCIEKNLKLFERTLQIIYYRKCMCITRIESACASKNSVVKKHPYLKELLKLFGLTIYNFSISYFVLEILRFV